MSVDAVEQERDQSTRQTYYGLRYGLATLAAMLYIAVLYSWLVIGCSQGSISAYYFTSARPVLIAALAGIGVGLIIYHGNTWWENLFLDVAGFLAIVVAFVPTGSPPPTPECSTSGGLLGSDLLAAVGPDAASRIEASYAARVNDDISSAVATSMVALFLAAGLAFVIDRVVGRANGSTLKPGSPDVRPWSAMVTLALLVVGAVFYLALDADTFRTWAHPVAAILFFALILTVMVLNGRASKQFGTVYNMIAGAAVAVMIVLILLQAVIADWVFWVETAGVAGFIAFWLIQSWELGGRVDRAAVPGATKVVQPAP